jgi:tRNA(fMet)-specific endonuclease VapC
MPTASPCLLDSDVLIQHFRGNPVVASRLEDYQRQHGVFDLSVISYYELERGAESNPRKRQLWQRFTTLCRIIELDRHIADTAAQMYQTLATRGDLIPDADLLIAATALTRGMTLVTHNTQHFSRIPGLSLEDWTR